MFWNSLKVNLNRIRSRYTGDRHPIAFDCRAAKAHFRSCSPFSDYNVYRYVRFDRWTYHDSWFPVTVRRSPSTSTSGASRSTTPTRSWRRHSSSASSISSASCFRATTAIRSASVWRSSCRSTSSSWRSPRTFQNPTHFRWSVSEHVDMMSNLAFVKWQLIV